MERDLKAKLTKASFQRNHARQVLEEETVNLEKTRLTLSYHKQAVEVVQLVAQSVEQAVHDKIAGVVSSCLNSVFDDPYEFKITFERKRNRTEARLSFVRDGLEVDPMTASGGGVVDVAAFALRVACLSLKQDIDKVLVLDEPFRFLSKEYRPRIRQLLQTLSADLGIQFIIVTHMDILKCGKVVELSK